MPSISSFSSSASTKIGYPSSEHEDDRNTKSKAFGPQCWRLNEVEDLLFQGDETSIRRLSRFGLYNDDFAELRGLEKFSSQAEDSLPFAEYWNLSLQLDKDSPASVASKLSEMSRCKFKCVRFEEFVRKAFGLSSPAIGHLLWQYQLLNVILYCMFIRNLKHKGFLLKLKEVSLLTAAPPSCDGTKYSNVIQSLENGKADPFVCAATSTAWEKVSNAANEDLDLKLNTTLDLALGLVIKPLQQALGKPDAAQSILQELETMNVLFCSHFYAPKVNWDVPFDNRIDLKSIGIFALAEALSSEDCAFYKLNVQSSQEDPRLLYEINGRWIRLCYSVKECLDTGVVKRSDMYRLAEVSLEACPLGMLLTIHFQEFYRRRNFYSFTAVISGTGENRFMTHTAHEGAFILDPTNEYKLAVHLRYMCEFQFVDACASSEDKMEYRPTRTEDSLECTGILGSFKNLARQISLGSCLSCFGL